jgi:hypothetical protein
MIPERRSKLVHAATEIAIVLLFVAMAVLATRPLVADLFDRTLAYGDPYVDLWTVDWLSKHFFEPSLVFQGNTFVPHRHAVLFSDLSLGTVVLLLPFRLLLDDPVPLYNVAVLIALAFGGYCFHLLARALTGNLWASLAAAILATHASHQLLHVYHLNLLTTGWIALFLLALHRLLEGPTIGRVALAGLAFALSAQSSGYYGVACLVLSLVFAAAHARRLLRPRTLLGYAAAALVAVALTAPYLRSYMELRDEQRLRRPIRMSVGMSFQPERDLTNDAYVYWSFFERRGERLFPGLLVLLLAGVAIVRRPPHAGFYGAATVVLLLLSLGPQLEIAGQEVPLPYRALFSVPPFDSMRHPYTFAAVALFTLALMAGIGAASLRAARSPRVGGLLVVLAILDTLSASPLFRSVPRGVPEAYEIVQRLPPAPVLEIPPFNEEALLWAARTGLPMMNGQGSAFVPRETALLNSFIQNHWIARTPADVDASRPAEFLTARFERFYLILPVRRGPALRDLAGAFDRSRLFRLVGEGAEGDRVYEYWETRPPSEPSRVMDGSGP